MTTKFGQSGLFLRVVLILPENSAYCIINCLRTKQLHINGNFVHIIFSEAVSMLPLMKYEVQYLYFQSLIFA